MPRPRLLELGSDLAPHLRLVRHPGPDEPVVGTRVRPFQAEQSGAIADSPRGIARTQGKAVCDALYYYLLNVIKLIKNFQAQNIS